MVSFPSFLTSQLKTHESPILVIGGPTAIGKTRLGITLAEELNGEVVAADSMQIYRYLDIGTAKPTLGERMGIPHHMIDVIDPDQPFSAADYRRLAQRAIQDIHGRGKIPIVVGGTGFYIKTLIRGLFHGPGGDPGIRARLQMEARIEKGRGLYERLKNVDPTSAARIHPNDIFRIIRALEVWELTGRPISSWQEEHRKSSHPIKAFIFGLICSRGELYRRVEARVDRMFEWGLVEEVRRNYSPDLRSLQGLGYGHVVGYIQGKYPLEEAILRMKRDTRRYAKRQITWFKRMEGIKWVQVEKEGDFSEPLSFIKKSLESQG